MKIKISSFLLLVMITGSSAISAQSKKIVTAAPKGMATAAFAEGCFWSSEHMFEAVAGVKDAVSGYAAGNTKNPSYAQVSSDATGHAETVLVYYDPKIVSYNQLLDVFYDSHDPTTKNRQGPDVGTPYRSVAFYKNADEKKAILNKIKDLTAKNVFKKPIVTQVLPLGDFYKAEDYHQEYIVHHLNEGYVRSVSIPRYNDFKKKYPGKLKPGE